MDLPLRDRQRSLEPGDSLSTSTPFPHTLSEGFIHTPHFASLFAHFSPIRAADSSEKAACDGSHSSIRQLVFVTHVSLNRSKPLIATTSCGLLSGIQHYPNWSQFGYAFRHAHPGDNPYFTILNGTNMDFEMSEVVVLVTHLLTSDPAPFASMKKTALQESKELDECTKQVGLSFFLMNRSV